MTFYDTGVIFMKGERLSELRKDRGYTQQQLGDRLSVSKYTISSYENNKTSPDDHNLILMAELFDVSLDYLMGLIDMPVSYNRARNYLQLPLDLTKEQMEQVRKYIEFLQFCNRQDSQKTARSEQAAEFFTENPAVMTCNPLADSVK